MISLTSRFGWEQHDPTGRRKPSSTPPAAAAAATMPLGPTALDGTGRVLTGDEFVKHTRHMGLCEKCGETRTHLRVKQSGLCLTPRLKPITSESDKGTYDVYKGYCLGPRCWRLDEVKRMLGETVAKKRYNKSPGKQRGTRQGRCTSEATPPNTNKDASQQPYETRDSPTGEPVSATKGKGRAKNNSDVAVLITESGRPVLKGPNDPSGPTNKKKGKDPAISGPELANEPPSPSKRPKNVAFVVAPSKARQPLTEKIYSPPRPLRPPRPRKNQRRNRGRDDYDLRVSSSPGQGMPVDVDFITDILDEPSLRGKRVTIHMDSQGELAADETNTAEEEQEAGKKKKVKTKNESRQDASQSTDGDSKTDSTVDDKEQQLSENSRTSPLPPVSEDAIQAFEEQMPSRSSPKKKHLPPLLPTRPTYVGMDKVDKKVPGWKSASCPALFPSFASDNLVVTPCTEEDSCTSKLEQGELINGFEIEVATPTLSESSTSDSTAALEEENDTSGEREEEKMAPSCVSKSPPLVSPSSIQRSRGFGPSCKRGELTLPTFSVPAEQPPGVHNTQPPQQQFESMTSMTTVAAANITGTAAAESMGTTHGKSGKDISIPPKHPLLGANRNQEVASSAASQSSRRSWRSASIRKIVKKVTTRQIREDDCRSLVSNISSGSDTLGSFIVSKSKSFRSIISKSSNRKNNRIPNKGKRCEESVAHSDATSLYPETDKSLRHARNAGVLWQTLVGQHVRFPSAWFDGARAPPMGVKNVRNEKGEQVPQHSWLYIVRDEFHSKPILNEFVPDQFAPGRLLLHIIIRDNNFKAVQDVAVGVYHPKKGRYTRTVWMAIRRRSLHHLGTTARIDPILCSECRIEDIMMESPLGTGRRLHNKSLQTLFGDKPPVQTVFIQEKELVKKVRAYRKAGHILDFTPITLVLIKLFIESRAFC